MQTVRRDVSYYMSLNYPVRVEPIAEELGGGWVAFIPVLGEKVFRATGDTAGEALDSLEELKEIYFEQLIDSGEEIPLPPAPRKNYFSGQVLVRMPVSLHEELVTTAEEEDVSLNALAVSLLSRGLGEEKAVCEFRQQVSSVACLNQGVLWASPQAYQYEGFVSNLDTVKMGAYSVDKGKGRTDFALTVR